jgi:hypothetical protein
MIHCFRDDLVFTNLDEIKSPRSGAFDCYVVISMKNKLDQTSDNFIISIDVMSKSPFVDICSNHLWMFAQSWSASVHLSIPLIAALRKSVAHSRLQLESIQSKQGCFNPVHQISWVTLNSPESSKKADLSYQQ